MPLSLAHPCPLLFVHIRRLGPLRPTFFPLCRQLLARFYLLHRDAQLPSESPRLRMLPTNEPNRGLLRVETSLRTSTSSQEVSHSPTSVSGPSHASRGGAFLSLEELEQALPADKEVEKGFLSYRERLRRLSGPSIEWPHLHERLLLGSLAGRIEPGVGYRHRIKLEDLEYEYANVGLSENDIDDMLYSVAVSTKRDNLHLLPRDHPNGQARSAVWEQRKTRRIVKAEQEAIGTNGFTQELYDKLQTNRHQKSDSLPYVARMIRIAHNLSEHDNVVALTDKRCSTLALQSNGLTSLTISRDC